VIFDHLLSRADEEVLQQLLGKSTLHLLLLLNDGVTTPKYLRDLLLSLRTREDILLDPESRALILDLLRPREAKILATILQASDSSNPYQALKKVKFRSKYDKEGLFTFFELQEPDAEKKIESPNNEDITSNYPLFPHQRRAAREIAQYLAKDPHRVLLHMPTGSGKTRTAMNIISNHLRSHEPTLVVWLAHSEELCEQAVVEFEKAWKILGDRSLSVHRFWGDRDLDLDLVADGLVVAGLSKLYNRAKKSISFINKLGNRCTLVVMDEAHQAIAKTYRLVLDALVVPYKNSALLGLSATPGRTWSNINADEELAEFFACRKVTLKIPGYENPVDYLIDQGYLAKAEFRSLMSESGITLSNKDLSYIQDELDLPIKVLESLAQDEQRNLKIILEVENLAKRHQRIILFAISVEHALLIASVLKIRGLHADAITGKSLAFDRDRVISSFKDFDSKTKILCNYGILTTGFDAPRASAAVIARPTRSLVLYSQMVGRAIRGEQSGGNTTAEIVTVVDSNLPGFGTIADAFTNWEDIWR
jgi:DNA repair protein RadD